MVTKEIKIAINKKIKSGNLIGEIKSELQKQGYTMDEINSCFEKNKADMRSWYLFFGVLFSIIGIGFVMKYNSIVLLIVGVILILLFFKEIDKVAKDKFR
jgi:hypothetical protein